MSAIKSSITKSRSGHYTVTVSSVSFGRMFIGRKIGTLDTARRILSEVRSNLIKGDGLVCRYDCLYQVNATNLSKFLSQ